MKRFLSIVSLIAVFTWTVFAYVTPTLPTTFTTPYSLPTGGTTWTVHAADNLQTVFDSAALGDVIVLDAGSTWTGNFKLPVKTGSTWLYVISSQLASLPAEGIRVKPSDAVHMPRILDSDNTRPGLSFFENAHHYRFVGIEFDVLNVALTGTYNLIASGYGGIYSDPSYLWTAVTTDAKLPHHITFDRCYIHSSNVYPKFTRCGWQMNGHYMASVDSYYKNFADTADSQAINIVQGTGPYKIVNNYLEATGENFFVGGTDPSITNANPEDIEFRGNYCYKDSAAWTTHWTIKNLFELKSGRRVLCTQNLMENCYKDGGQQGATGIVITVRDQNGANLGAQLQDITVTYNRIHSVGKAWRVTGYDDTHPSLQTQRVLIENNAADDLNIAYAASASGESVTTGATGPALDITIRHNLVLANPVSTLTNLEFLTAPTGIFAVKNFTYENNIISHGRYGLFGNAIGTGTVALTRYADATGTGTVWRKNVVINRVIDADYAFWKTHFSSYPANNSLADTDAAVGFTDQANSDYSLTVGSAYHNWGADGLDPGPNWAVLSPYITAARNGQALNPPSITVSDLPVQVVPAFHYTVTFSGVDVTGSVKAEVSRNGGASYSETITIGQIASEGNIDWLVANGMPSTNAVVKVTSLDNPTVFGVSLPFTIGCAFLP